MTSHRRPTILFFLAALSLLLACGFLERLNPATPGPTLTPAPTSTPADTTPPVFTSVVANITTLKNGDTLLVSAETGEEGLALSADFSQLDSTCQSPIRFQAKGEGRYIAKLAVSFANLTANGAKQIAVSAADPAGNVTRQVVEVTLSNPAPVLDENPPNDSFDGTILNQSKWNFLINWDLHHANNGMVQQNGKLVTTTDDQEPDSSAMILSTWNFPGDFDIQIDFEAGEGWDFPRMGHLDGAVLGVIINGHSYHITRLKWSSAEGGPADSFMAWQDLDTFDPEVSTSALTGKYRLIRAGRTLAYLYDIGDGWKELGTLSVPTSPATVYIGNSSIGASLVFTTYFDNFIINSGLTSH